MQNNLLLEKIMEYAGSLGGGTNVVTVERYLVAIIDLTRQETPFEPQKGEE